MSTKYNRIIKAIVIHHMGDGLPPTVPISQRWNPFGYDTPEYDFGIEFDGTIRNGRPLTVQGAHCLSDKPPYSQKGDQWWNKNSIGIGIAGDFTKYPMPQAQFNGLVVLVKKLIAQYNLTLDDCYPHGQVCYTDCCGCNYSKVPALHGLWSYDDFETAVKSDVSTIQTNNNKGSDNDMLDVAILKYSSEDEWSAKDIDAKFGGVANFTRQGTDKKIPSACLNSKLLIIIGGSDIPTHSNRIYLSGNTKYDTAILVGKYLG